MKLAMGFTLLLTTVCASGAFAACGKGRTPDAPAIPPGSDATVREMYEAQNKVKDYIKSMEDYLACVVSPSVYNYKLDQVHSVADAFNREVRVFKARHARL